MIVKDVIEVINSAFPFEDAEDWDHPGLSVGNPQAQVSGIACALDQTPATIKRAHEQGANVLVTHHPLFINPPDTLTPQVDCSSMAGSAMWWAAHLDVSLIAAHTNLDKSDAAMDFLADGLGLSRTGRLEEPYGFGAMCQGNAVTSAELLERCKQFHGGTPIYWPGSKDCFESIVICSGSTGDCAQEAISQHIDCIICGECGYHKLLDLNEAGVGVILLGHDCSERPFASLLANTLKQSLSDICIEVLTEPQRWQAFV